MTEKLSIVELSKHIGQKAIWTAKNGLKFQVEIRNVEILYGSSHYTVTPVAGEGQARIRDRLEIML